MKMTHILGLLLVSGLFAALPLTAKDKPGKPHDRGKGQTPPPRIIYDPGTPPPEFRHATHQREPWVKVDVAISDHERRTIRTYVDDHEPRGVFSKRKGKGLPPGLAKKVARGGELPPGWQKHCVVGQIMPVEVYERCHPLPVEVVPKLPPPPPDTVTVTVSGKVVRLIKATHEILDVFDVHGPF